MSELDRKSKEVDNVKASLKGQQDALKRKEEECDRRIEQANRQIESIAGMTAQEAKAQLMENMKAEARTEAQAYINDTIDEARLNAAKEAKRIVINTIQRTATETAIENAVTTFPIDNDEIKGRIIGREGRNIRALEAATGVEIVVDDTPDAIMLSAFDPVRREVARLALHQLVIDGRIHPARIEEVVTKVQKQLEDEILETGKRTCIDLGIHGMSMELVRLIGRMKYRSSYGQNLLQHSREVANICAIMASELGLNPKIAKRAGLLHDIGKVSEEEPDLPHALLGMRLAEQFKEKPEICNAIGAHHELRRPSRRPPRGDRILHQAPQGHGRPRRRLSGRDEVLRHPGRPRAPRHRGRRPGVRRRGRSPLRRDRQEDPGRDDLSGPGEDHRDPGNEIGGLCEVSSDSRSSRE